MTDRHEDARLMLHRIVECWANGPRNAIRPGHELPETLAKERKEAADESDYQCDGCLAYRDHLR